ncbi:GIY-YIG nuclease family protein [Candidatus Parcubacteria bacterium]|nr:MAG: GIY-YIG nuclease family protein [Candidatus Parcubacteria bacterium]
MKLYYVYIMSNKYNNVLYIGVTNDIYRRVLEHKEKLIKGFTEKYNIDKLVYYEGFNSIYDALNREKQLKNWHRQWKMNLIASINPEWKDLSDYLQYCHFEFF